MIIIPKRDLEKLLDLALLPNESTFLMQCKEENGIWKYESTPLILEGKEHSAPRIMKHPDFEDVRKESEKNGLILIEGHTHPAEEGEIIYHYSCGWSILRNDVMRNYRNRNLEETEQGRAALKYRGELIERIFQEHSSEEREKLAESIRKVMETEFPQAISANLVKVGGIDCYITNRINSKNEKELREDRYEEGDADLREINMGYYLFGISAMALIYPPPAHQFEKSSKEKYKLDVLQPIGFAPLDVKQIPLQIK